MAIQVLKGFGSPFRIDSNTGGVRVVFGTDVVTEGIRTVVGTIIEERLFLKMFGSRLPLLTMEGIQDEILDLAQHEIMLAIGQFEPRADVREVRFFEDQEAGQIRIGISYQNRVTGQFQQLLV